MKGERAFSAIELDKALDSLHYQAARFMFRWRC